jgi:hypothetical protein
MSYQVRAIFLWMFGSVLVSMEAADTTNVASVVVRNGTTSFKHFVAFSADFYGERRFVVLATNTPVSASVLKKVRAKRVDENYDEELDQPYLKAAINEKGEFLSLSGSYSNGNTSGVFLSSQGIVGGATISPGSIEGNATFKDEGDFAKSVTMKFKVPLDAIPASGQKPAIEPPVKPTVTGEFVGNGKKASIQFISVRHHEKFNGKRAITILFTEKEHPKDSKAETKAVFGEYGSAIILHVNENGGIFGCEIAHTAHAKSPFTSLGEIAMNEFDMSTGNAKGQVTTPGELDTFGQKWSVDLKFAAPLPAESIKEMTAKEEEDDEKSPLEKRMDDEDDEDEDDDFSAKKKPSREKEIVPTLKIVDLPLPASAKDIQYKALVKQFTFQSEQKIPALAAEVQKTFAGKGWKSAASPLIRATSAIIELTQGEARLTLMMKPKGNGTETLVMTRNLDWSGADTKKARPRRESKDDEDDDDDFEKEALDAINDALDELKR